jgi:UDP-N-acetylglucosamine 2-epimerase
VGPGVIEAFHAGLGTVHLEDFDYVCKLDMDLDLPVHYFELLIQRMESDPRVGDSGGVQEEAPSLGKPVLVMCDTTERPEGWPPAPRY